MVVLDRYNFMWFCIFRHAMVLKAFRTQTFLTLGTPIVIIQLSAYHSLIFYLLSVKSIFDKYIFNFRQIKWRRPVMFYVVYVRHSIQ
jgi:hypothetical protein